MIEFIGPLHNLVTTVHKSLYDWALASSDPATPPAGLHCTALNSLPWTILTSLYSLGADSIENTFSNNTRRVHLSVV
jgi:hypothetical protein